MDGQGLVRGWSGEIDVLRLLNLPHTCEISASGLVLRIHKTLSVSYGDKILDYRSLTLLTARVFRQHHNQYPYIPIDARATEIVASRYSQENCMLDVNRSYPIF